VPSYLIVIYYTHGGNSRGIRYTDLKTVPEIQEAVRIKMREAGKLDLVAAIRVELATRPAEKNL
jgi:hypothetical protein